MASLVISEDAWARARRRYTEDLTESEREIFNNASLENVFYSASAMQKAHQAQSTTRRLGTKLQPLVAAIDQYGKALDVFANGSSLLLCPLWGSLRVVLHLASEFQKYFEKLVDMFVRIGDVLPQFWVYEKLFASHERLVQALSKVYVDILEFCTDAKAVFRRGKRPSMSTFNIPFKLLWKPFNQQFGKVMDDFREHRKNVEKEAGIAHMIEAKQARDLEVWNRAQLEKERKDQDRLHFLSMLSSVQYEIKHQKMRRLRHRQTGAWLTRMAEFLSWKDSRGSACLCCYGIPGSGKTILASNVIDTLLNQVHQEETVTYHYCDYSDQKTLETSSILGTIIKQLLLRRPIIPDSVVSLLREAYKSGARVLDKDELVEILCSILAPHDQRVFLVIDGLDECVLEVQKEVLSVVTVLMALDRVAVKIYISSRKDTQISITLRDYPQINIHESQLTADITLFVEETVKLRMDEGDLVLRDPTLEQEIVSELVSKAHGMFLWVFLQLEDICDATQSDAGIRETLRHLPEGLIATYQRILTKIGRKNPRNMKMVQRILKWVLCARRPLSIGELKEAIAVEPGDEAWDIGKISTDPNGQRLIQSCGNLVVLDIEDGAVHFIHHSVQQYLLSEQQTDLSPGFCFELSEVELYSAEICVTYLSFSDFERQITTSSPNRALERTGILAPAGMSQIPSVLGIGKRVFGILHQLRGGDTKQNIPDLDYAELVSRGKKIPPAPALDNKYSFLNYAIEHWTWHTRALLPESRMTGIWLIFKRLALDRVMPFDIREWGANLGPPSLPYMTLFLWAVETGHEPLLALLLRPPTGLSLSAYYDHARVHNFEVILSACSHGHMGVIKLLTDDDKSLLADPELFLRAAENGHKALIQYTLEHTPLTNLDDLRARDGGRALRKAMKNNHVTMVQLLHEMGFEGPVPTAEIAFWAAEHGHTTTLQYLIKETPDIDFNVRNAVGDQCVHLAAFNGHTSTILWLIKRIDSLDSMNFKGEKALDLAASNGHTTVIQLLLDAGAGGHEALHRAATSGHEAVILYILEHTLVSNLHDLRKRDGGTALKTAMRNNHVTIVQLLYQWGFEGAVSTAEIIFWAAEYSHTTMLQYLIKEITNISLNAQNVVGDQFVHLAAFNEHTSIIQLLIERLVSSDSMNNEEETGMDLAASKRYTTVTQLLLEAGAQYHNWLHRVEKTQHESAVKLLLEKGTDVVPALHVKKASESLRAIQLLLIYGEDIDAMNDYKNTLLHRSASCGHEAIARLLLEHGANIETVDFHKSTPLHEAVANSHEATAQLLLEIGANSEAVDIDGMTVLHKAALDGHEAMVRLLVEKRANIEAVTVHKDTPLHLSARRGCETVVRLLVEKGANIEAVNGHKNTPLHLSAWCGHEAIVRLLVEKGANIEAGNVHKGTPLHLSACFGRKAVVRLLLGKGANIQTVSINKSTPLHTAAAKGHEEIIRLLLEKGANIDAVNFDRVTALHEAALGGHEAVAQLLVQMGANVRMVDGYGTTALEMALKRGHPGTARVLLLGENNAGGDHSF